jgi:putative tricarboxylic transport membrane protein
VAFGLAWLGPASPAAAQAPWKPDRPVEIIVGTDPGSGNDRSARTLQKIWRSNKLVEVPVTVLNRPGGFGAVAWSYLNTHPRSGTYLAAMSTLMLTNEISGNSPLSYRDFTPLAILLNEEIAIGVYGGSAIKTGRDLLAKLRQDPASVSFAVSGIGGQNHIALGLVASPAGVDVAKLKMIGFAGSADSITAVIGGHVEGTAAPASLIAAQVATGRLSALGVGAEHRLSGPLLGRRVREDDSNGGMEAGTRAQPARAALSRLQERARLSRCRVRQDRRHHEEDFAREPTTVEVGKRSPIRRFMRWAR